MEKPSSSISSFSKFLLKILLVVGLCGVAFSYVFEYAIIFQSEISGAYKVNRILSQNNLAEVPIIGSSRAQGSYVPSILFGDGSCFNYGIDGTQANISLFFLEQELLKNKQTDILYNLDLGGLIYADGDLGNYIPNYSKTKDILRTKGSFHLNVPFINYYGHYESYLKYYLNERLNLTKVTESGGSFEKNVLPADKFKQLVEKRRAAQSAFTLDPDLAQQLDSLLNSTDRRVFFIVAPYHPSYFESFPHANRANNWLRGLNTRTNATVIDLRDQIEADSLYMNTTHVNYEGAVLFSKQLKELLTNEAVLQDGFGPFLKSTRE